jgi:hypothetical protein
VGNGVAVTVLLGCGLSLLRDFKTVAACVMSLFEGEFSNQNSCDVVETKVVVFDAPGLSRTLHYPDSCK